MCREGQKVDMDFMFEDFGKIEEIAEEKLTQQLKTIKDEKTADEKDEKTDEDEIQADLVKLRKIKGLFGF